MKNIILATALLTNIVSTNAAVLFVEFKMDDGTSNKYTYRLTLDGSDAKFTTDYPGVAIFQSTTKDLCWTGAYPKDVQFTIDSANRPKVGDEAYGLYYYFEPPYPFSIMGLSPATKWSSNDSVPEPLSIGLFALGLGAFAAYRKRN